ncbi:50S ribosomal protein L6 [Candidatus Uhrbacteria bacterium CG_4_9_14_3_um_filter_36_7]|uniref:Large ribosomal subunit protein uL6 n=1 Tax=Candidatus Uhrbacteria bacterium CG_4_9_14_3_um_filter_36_7 TaxID=1975033 RepID=A0A2M7XHC7_9BACT|nr:MAG: 50S ribosomal protein L6 [Candidatus Uhrbacteria bacterium CG_4_9_14_3_um_filter_36_7]
MSRIGKKPIVLPADVEVIQSGTNLTIKGPLGTLSLNIPLIISLEKKQEDTTTVLELSVNNSEDRQERSMWGTMRSLIQNAVTGVTKGFSKKMDVVGVGYRVSLKGENLVFEVGFSHPVTFSLPEGIKANVENTSVTITGIDRQLVGETAARIRKIRKPEPYKGKGIKYTDEVIRRKAGKTSAG